jgi:hypothetical protein
MHQQLLLAALGDKVVGKLLIDLLNLYIKNTTTVRVMRLIKLK